MTFIRYKKRGNKWYVYKILAFWDKKLKKPRQKSEYLGVALAKGGQYLKNKRLIANTDNELIIPTTSDTILDFGDSYILSKISETGSFSSIIKNTIGNFDSLISLIFYQIIEGQAMYNCKDWSEGNIICKLFPKANLKSQNISKLINFLGREDIKRKFFKKYIEQFFKKKHEVLIDSTALPSAINSSINSWGYSSDGINQNVSCVMLVDKISKLPIYFRAISGDIPDVSSLKTTVDEIIRLGLKTKEAIFDAGYFSEKNICYLCQQKIDFLIRMPKSRKAFQQLINSIKNIELKKNAVKYGKRIVFIKSKKINLYNQKLYAHIILDPNKKVKDLNYILTKSLENPSEFKNTNSQIKSCGFIIFISISKIEKEDVLPHYYTRQSIEQIFGFAKSENNILPLRVHSTQSINGYLLLVFLSLVLYVMIRQKLKSKYTVEQSLLILRGLKAKIYDKQIVVQEPTKKIKDIAKLLDIIMPTSLGI